MNSYCVSGAAGAPQAKGTRSIDKSNGEANAQVHRAKQGVKHSIKCHLINTPRSSININQRMMKLGLGFKAHSRRVIHCRDQLVFFLSSSFFLSLFLSIFCWFLFLVTVVLWEGSPVEQIYIYIYISIFYCLLSIGRLKWTCRWKCWCTLKRLILPRRQLIGWWGEGCFQHFTAE